METKKMGEDKRMKRKNKKQADDAEREMMLTHEFLSLSSHVLTRPTFIRMSW